MQHYLRYWWDSYSQIVPSDSEKYFKVYYDEQGRDTLIEEYEAGHKLVSSTHFNWGRLAQVKLQRDDMRPFSGGRRWLWKMIERFLVQRSFRRPLWRKVICALVRPDFLVRLDWFDADGNLQEYFLYVYFPDGRLAGVDQYLADGTFVSSLPVE